MMAGDGKSGPRIPHRSRIANSTRLWTAALVLKRLRRAVVIQAALNTERLVADIAAERGTESMGTIGDMGAYPKGGAAGGDVLRHAAEALSWLGWLEPDDAGIVLARLEGAPWKAICFRFGISRPTADRRYRYALALIAWRLNGHARADRSPSLRTLLGMRRAA